MTDGLGSFRFMFGKHKGMRIEDVPIDYLQWILTEDFKDDIRDAAIRELAIRPQTIMITNHALDRCSQRLLQMWMDDRQASDDPEKGEGMATWLKRKATEALKVNPVENGTPAIEHNGIKFAFEKNGGALTLKTVIKK